MAFHLLFGYACFAIKEEGGQNMAEEIKNLCAPIPIDLHAQVRERQEASGKTLGQYMTWLITQFYELEKGGHENMQENSKRYIIQLYIHQRHPTTNRHECIGYANKQPPAKHIQLHFQD